MSSLPIHMLYHRERWTNACSDMHLQLLSQPTVNYALLSNILEQLRWLAARLHLEQPHPVIPVKFANGLYSCGREELVSYPPIIPYEDIYILELLRHVCQVVGCVWSDLACSGFIALSLTLPWSPDFVLYRYWLLFACCSFLLVSVHSSSGILCVYFVLSLIAFSRSQVLYNVNEKNHGEVLTSMINRNLQRSLTRILNYLRPIAAYNLSVDQYMICTWLLESSIVPLTTVSSFRFSSCQVTVASWQDLSTNNNDQFLPESQGRAHQRIAKSRRALALHCTN